MVVLQPVRLCARAIVSGRSRILTSPRRLSMSSNAPAGSTPYEDAEYLVSNKVRQIMNWYEEFTGLKDVRLAQERVLKAQDNFIAIQDERRQLSKQLSIIRERLKEIRSELDLTTKGEDRFVFFITEEHKVLKEERKLNEAFSQCEQKERENFSILSSSVKESHEKERTQAEKTKYWSVIGSVLGTVLGVAGSSINNEFKMRELRKLVKESAANLSPQHHGDLARELTVTTSNLKELVRNIEDSPRTVKIIQDQTRVMQAHIQELQKFMKKDVLIDSSTSEDHSVAENVRNGILGATVMALLSFILVSMWRS